MFQQGVTSGILSRFSHQESLRSPDTDHGHSLRLSLSGSSSTSLSSYVVEEGRDIPQVNEGRWKTRLSYKTHI